MAEPTDDSSSERPALTKKAVVKRIKKARGATTRHAKRFVVRRVENVRAVRRTVVVWLLGVGLVVAGIAMQSYLSATTYTQRASANGGTYAEAVHGNLDTLNPLYASSDPELSAVRLMFSSLYDYDSTGTLRGDLATNLSVDESGKVYTITIRQGVKWHDGTELTAKDVAYTVDLIKNPATRSPLYSSWRDVSVQTLNDTTVQFTLQSPYVPFRYALTFAILPQHLLASIPPSTLRESNYSVAPVGSGPFSFRLLQEADLATGRKVLYLEGNKSYYRGAPRLSRFELHNYAMSADLNDTLKANEVTGAVEVFDPQVSSSMTVHYAPIERGAYAFFNLKNDLFKSPEIRRALMLATDTTMLTHALGNGTTPLDTPFMNGQLTGDDIPTRPVYDLDKAKELLDAAGWKLNGSVREKDGKKLTITITTTKNPLYERTVDELAKQWQKLGIDVQTRIIDDNVAGTNFASDVLQPRAYDVLVRELAVGADMDVYAYWHSSQNSTSGLNFSGYSNVLVDDHLAAARIRSDVSLRMVKYKAFTRLWLSDVPAIGLYQPSLEYVTRSSAQSIVSDTPLPSAIDRYSNVIDWTVEQQSVYKTR